MVSVHHAKAPILGCLFAWRRRTRTTRAEREEKKRRRSNRALFVRGQRPTPCRGGPIGVSAKTVYFHHTVTNRTFFDKPEIRTFRLLFILVRICCATSQYNGTIRTKPIRKIPRTVVPWLYTYILGVRNEEVAYKKIVIAPYFFDVQCNAGGNIHTPYGDLVLHWQKSEKEFSADIFVPQGAAAELVLPENQKITLESGKLNHFQTKIQRS